MLVLERGNTRPFPHAACQFLSARKRVHFIFQQIVCSGVTCARPLITWGLIWRNRDIFLTLFWTCQSTNCRHGNISTASLHAERTNSASSKSQPGSGHFAMYVLSYIYIYKSTWRRQVSALWKHALVDKIYGCPIFRGMTETSLKDSAPGFPCWGFPWIIRGTITEWTMMRFQKS